MKILFAACLVAFCSQAFAQGVAADWFPMDVGNQWVYRHESRDSQVNSPQIRRWETVETISGVRAVPEGTVILRHVEIQGDKPTGWLAAVYSESNYLLRNGCLYFLNPQTWDERERRLQPEYRAQLLAGDAEPELCFPLAASASTRPLHIGSGDETHLRFEKGVGITSESSFHHGTYGEYRVTLLRFVPAKSRL